MGNAFGIQGRARVQALKHEGERENQLPKVVFRPPDMCHGINATLFIPNPKSEKKDP